MSGIPGPRVDRKEVSAGGKPRKLVTTAIIGLIGSSLAHLAYAGGLVLAIE